MHASVQSNYRSANRGNSRRSIFDCRNSPISTGFRFVLDYPGNVSKTHAGALSAMQIPTIQSAQATHQDEPRHPWNQSWCGYRMRMQSSGAIDFPAVTNHSRCRELKRAHCPGGGPVDSSEPGGFFSGTFSSGAGACASGASGAAGATPSGRVASRAR